MNTDKGRKWIFLHVCLLLNLLLSGCSILHRNSVTQDREDYTSAMAKSDNEQILINIVRLRYLDAPHFLQVSNITAQKNVTASADSVIAFFNPYRALSGGTIFGPAVSYSDTPTISFTPLQGRKFASSMLFPIEIKTIYYFVNAGWSIDKLFDLSLHNLGAYFHTKDITTGEFYQNSNNFHKAIHLLAILQKHGAIDFDFKTLHKKQELIIHFISHKKEKAEIEFKRMMNIPLNTPYVRLTSQNYEGREGNVILMKTRSVYSMMSYLAYFVQVPSNDKAASPFKMPNIKYMKIYYSDSPVRARIRVFYRGHYFYIRDDDSVSKRTFLLLYDLYQVTAGLANGYDRLLLTLPLGK